MSKCVVIVDDSNFIRKQLVKFFTKELDYTVLAEGNCGEDAIKLYRKHKPDLLTLDIVMDGMNGVDAVQEIIGEFPNANILMISAVRTGEMLDAVTLGAKDYIEKPLKLRDPSFIKEFKDTITELFSM